MMEMEEWRNGGMEEWRIGEMEKWRIGGSEWRPTPSLPYSRLQPQA
jgi:hypothetical protein